MRRIHQKQQSLTPVWIAHEHVKELEAISEILDSNPTIAAVAAQDLIDPEKDSGRGGGGGVRKDILPITKRHVGGQYYGFVLVPAVDELEEDVRCRVVVCQVPAFIDAMPTCRPLCTDSYVFRRSMTMLKVGYAFETPEASAAADDVGQQTSTPKFRHRSKLL